MSVRSTLAGSLFWRVRMNLNQRSVRDAKDAINSVGKETERATKKVTALNSVMKGLGISIGILGITQMARGLVSSIQEYERLSATLETVTGSTEEAARAQEFIQGLATRLPFSIGQVTEAYIRLRGMGIEPTEAQIMSLGNVGGAMSASLDALVGAAQSAARGMPRALEGILRTDIQTNSNTIGVLLDGQRIEIERSAEAVLGFLEELGDTRYSGGARRLMSTLTGAFSNFKDVMFQVASTIGRSGFSRSLGAFVRSLGDFFERITPLLSAMVAPISTILTMTSAVLDAWPALLALTVMYLTRIIYTQLPALIGAMQRVVALAWGLVTPFSLAAGSVAILGLAVEDFYAFLQGRESLIGLLLPKDTQARLHSFFAPIFNFFRGIAKDSDGLLGGISLTFQRFGAIAFTGVMNWVRNLASSISNAFRAEVNGFILGLNRIIPEGYEIPLITPRLEATGDAANRRYLLDRAFQGGDLQLMRRNGEVVDSSVARGMFMGEMLQQGIDSLSDIPKGMEREIFTDGLRAVQERIDRNINYSIQFDSTIESAPSEEESAARMEEAIRATSEREVSVLEAIQAQAEESLTTRLIGEGSALVNYVIRGGLPTVQGN